MPCNPESSDDIVPCLFSDTPQTQLPETSSQRPARLSQLADSTLYWYHQWFGKAATKNCQPCHQGFKLPGQAVVVMSVSDPVPSHLFYATDCCSCGLRFVVVSGSVVSLLPPSCTECKHPHVGLTLQAINNTSIATYSNHSLTLDLSYGTLSVGFSSLLMSSDPS